MQMSAIYSTNFLHFYFFHIVFKLLSDVQEHLDITIDKVDPSMKVPVNEFDGKVTYGQKRRNTGTDQGASQIYQWN